MKRRDFFALCGAAAVGALLPTSAVAANKAIPIVWGDGIHDDASALQYWIDGGAVECPFIQGDVLHGGDFLLSRGLRVKEESRRVYLWNNRFTAGDAFPVYEPVITFDKNAGYAMHGCHVIGR